MRHWIVPLAAGLLVLFILFVGWMNITPGHFYEYQCGCGVTYGKNEPISFKFRGINIPPPCPTVVCQDYKAIGLTMILVPLSNLDFNK